MKVYISGPITGHFDYVEKFNNAEKYLASIGHVPVNPAWIKPGLDYDDYMVIDLAMLSTCDAIYMLEGYEHSKGAGIELEQAIKDGLLQIYEKDSAKSLYKQSMVNNNKVYVLDNQVVNDILSGKYVDYRPNM